MKIKTRMIGMDLDGTLLKSDKELTQYTKDVLKRAIEQGIIVMPATGRPITGVPKELLEFPGIRYAVTANGGRVIDLEKNEAIVEELLPHDIAEVMMDVFEHYDTFREIYFDGVGYASREALEHIGKYLSVPAMANYIMSTRVAVDDVRVKFDETKLPVDKIQALFTSVEDRDAARKEIEDVPGIEITGALPMNLEINAAGVNKGKAMIELGKLLGIPREEIMAFGDGNNDLKMLKEVGTGVAMENAIPSVKEAAEYVTLSNDEEGVAKFIEKYVLDYGKERNMLDIIKVIILGIVEGITEWLPVSSTGHLILVGNVLKPSMSDAFMEMFDVVIQLGAIMAVVVLYFHKLNPFSPRKSHKQKMLTWQMWIKVLIASVPAGIVGVLFNDILDEIFYKPIPVAVMLIVYGILFIVVENHNAGKKPSVTRISQLSVQMLLWIGFFQMLALIPGTSRSGATIVGALLIGVSREVAAEFTFFLAIPAMFGASLLKLIKFGFHFTGAEFGLLMLGCIVSFGLSVIAIKFLMGYIKQHDFKVFGYYRIVLGGLIIVWTIIQTVIA